MYDNLNATEFEQGYKGDSEVVLLDVRTPQEHAEGHIPNSLNINLMDPAFMQQIQQLDASKTYYVYCRSGGRSSSACGAMASVGFTKLSNLVGGMMQWHGEVATV